jgi:transcriptional regulator with XRE-family HTH domain
MSDKALMEFVGNFIKQKRLEKNLTQNLVAESAGVSRSTLSLLERGKTVTLATFIQVLRVLDQLHVFEVFTVQKQLSPIKLAKLEQEIRERARGTNKIQS